VSLDISQYKESCNGLMFVHTSLELMYPKLTRLKTGFTCVSHVAPAVIMSTRLSALVANKSAIASFFQATVSSTKAQNPHTNLNGVWQLLPLTCHTT
jgi:hypothetical protein